MITLIEYFEQQEQLYGMDIAYEEQMEVYEMMQEDDDSFEDWCAEHQEIDMSAMSDDGFSIVDHWGWSMEEVF